MYSARSLAMVVGLVAAMGLIAFPLATGCSSNPQGTGVGGGASCSGGCAHLATTSKCPIPVDQGKCTADGEKSSAKVLPACSGQWNAFVSCMAATPVVICTSSGYPSNKSCDSEYGAWDDCERRVTTDSGPPPPDVGDGG